MASFDFSNIIGCGVGQFNTEGYGKMNFPILYLDSPITAGDGWASNTGKSPVEISAEFSVIRDKVSGSLGANNYITDNNVVINISGSATLTRSDGAYIFNVGGISVWSGFSAQFREEVTAPFTALKGTNDVYTMLTGTWDGLSPVLIYQPCSIGKQGYATFIGILEGGNQGPLSGGGLFSQSELDTITNWITENTTTPSTDPYEPGGEIEPGGGEGDFDDTSDPIDFPPMPTLSAVDTGFLTLFNPTLEQLKNLSSYMWSDLFDIEGWKKIFANPMDAILGLTIVPVAVPDSGTGMVTVGNISTGISMTKAAGQYVEVDCGTLNVNEYWGAYLDYDPYTKAEIYLPFIGIHALSTDDIMKKPVHVKYHIDLLSGACCAYVKCGNSVLYSFVGQCSCAVPTTSSDWSNIINGALSIAGSIGSMVATGGASAPMAAGAIASAAVNSLKPNIEKSGSMGGMGGMLGLQQPYIILTRPRQALPPKLNTYNGYPSFITKTLGELTGFTIVDSIHLEKIPATGAEISEIESLLKEGVIL